MISGSAGCLPEFFYAQNFVEQKFNKSIDRIGKQDYIEYTFNE